eukprot:6353586-Prymnesium_polylepis.1
MPRALDGTNIHAALDGAFHSMKPPVLLTLAASALAYGEGNAAVRLAPPPSTATLSWAAGSEVAPCAVRWPGAASVRLDILLPAGASELAAES